MVPELLRKRWKRFYDEFISLRGTPENIAFSLAVGIFVGTTPTIPFHTAITVALVFLLRRNVTAAFLGSWLISNPLTIPVLYLSQYELGKRLLGVDHLKIVFQDYSFWTVLHMGKAVMMPLLVGGAVMAPFVALGSYFLAVRALRTVRNRTVP
jgi:uncharacterized protein (DUF2062 family)